MTDCYFQHCVLVGEGEGRVREGGREGGGWWEVEGGRMTDQ